MPDSFHVIIPDRDIRFNAVLDYNTAEGDFHAEGYREAAEVLLQRFIDDPNEHAMERDTLVLPILFLFRHYLELRFKEIILYGKGLSGQSLEVEYIHDLQKLWKQVIPFCKAILEMKTHEQLRKVHDCVVEMSELDPVSISFRYPRDREGKRLFRHRVISLRHLYSAILEIGNFLDDISTEMHVRLQDSFRDRV